MFEGIINFFKNLGKKDGQTVKSKDAAKERLHLVLMQDRANVSADFLDLMKQEIIEVIKKYIDVDDNAIDVRLTNKANGDGLAGAPALYANIPIVSIKEEVKSKIARQTNEETQTDSKENEVVKEEKPKEEIVQTEENNEGTTNQDEIKQVELENQEENREDNQEEKIENREISQEELKEQEAENKEEVKEQFQNTSSNQPIN